MGWNLSSISTLTRDLREGKKVSESDEDREEDLIEKTKQGPLQEKNH